MKAPTSGSFIAHPLPNCIVHCDEKKEKLISTVLQIHKPRGLKTPTLSVSQKGC
ncbi:hypothetical protein EXN66_Car014563 [Channa argus]|uniref:Uncharacterized protein n=1 Tax=Channa argus TaxID=215402 RepID=A0A6G1Q9P4_CHAAH|nr:hypothetical protein EXN66_Car014563 [Channa argus]